MIETAGFGGGCHWCTEAVFRSLAGVTDVRQGFISADAPHDSYSEAVSVTSDAGRISFEDLILAHLLTHASTSNHKMRGKYRSAVYVHEAESGIKAAQIIDRLGQDSDSAFVTQVLPFRMFKPSDARFQDYYENNRGGPFCDTYIEPKLALLRQSFSKLQSGALSHV